MRGLDILRGTKDPNKIERSVGQIMRTTYDDKFKNPFNNVFENYEAREHVNPGIDYSNRDYLNGFEDPFKQDIEELRAQRQSTGTKLFRGVPRVIAKAATEIAKIPGVALGIGAGALGQMADLATGEDNTDFMSVAFDNALIRPLNDLNEWINSEVLPVYVRKAVSEGNLWDNITSPEFYATDGADGLGYIAAMFVPGGILNRLKLGSKVFGAVGDLSGISKGIKFSDKALTNMQKMAKLGLPTNAKNFDLYSQTIANTVLEAGAESQQAGQQYEEENLWKTELSPDDPAYMSLEELNQNKSNIMANIFKGNAVILIGPNAIMSKMLWGGVRNSTRGLKNFKFEDGVINQIEKKGALKTVNEIGQEFGKAGFREGFWEEGMQSATSDYFSANPEAGFLSSIGEIPQAYADMISSVEGQKAIYLGKAFGGGMQNITNFKQSKKEVENTNKLISYANSKLDNYWKNFEGDIYKKDEDGKIIKNKSGKPELDEKVAIERLQRLNQLEQLSDVYDQALADGNGELASQLRNEATISLIEPFLNNEQLGVEALNQYLQTAPGVEAMAQNEGVSKESIISDIMDKAKSLELANQTFDNFSDSIIDVKNDKATPEDAKSFFQGLRNKYFAIKARHHFVNKQLEKLTSQLKSIIEEKGVSFEEFNEDKNSKLNLITSDARIENLSDKINNYKEAQKELTNMENDFWNKKAVQKEYDSKVNLWDKIREEEATKQEEVTNTLNEVENAKNDEELDNISKTNTSADKVINDAIIEKRKKLREEEEARKQAKADEQQKQSEANKETNSKKEESKEDLGAKIDGYNTGEEFSLTKGELLPYIDNLDQDEYTGIIESDENNTEDSVTIRIQETGEEITIPKKVSKPQPTNLHQEFNTEGSENHDDLTPKVNENNEDLSDNDNSSGTPLLSQDRTKGRKIYFKKAGKKIAAFLGEKFAFVTDKFLNYERTPSNKKGTKVTFKVNLGNNSNEAKKDNKETEGEAKGRMSYSKTQGGINVVNKENSRNHFNDFRAEARAIGLEDGSGVGTVERNGKKYRLASVRLNISRPDIREFISRNSGSQRAGNVYVAIEITENTPDNIDQILVQEAIDTAKEEFTTITDWNGAIADESTLNSILNTPIGDPALENNNQKGFGVKAWDDAIAIYNRILNGEKPSQKDIDFLIDNLPINGHISDEVFSPINTVYKLSGGKPSRRYEKSIKVLRTNIVNALLNGAKIEDISTTVEGQYGGVLIVDSLDENNKVRENNILELFHFNGMSDKAKIKYVRENIGMINQQGDFIHLDGSMYPFNKPNGKGEVYLLIPKANGELFPLKLNIRRLNNDYKEGVVNDILAGLYKTLLSEQETKGSTLFNNIKDESLKQLIKDNLDEEKKLIGKPWSDITVSDFIEFLVFDRAKSLKSRIGFVNTQDPNQFVYGDPAKDGKIINSVEEFDEAHFKEWLSNNKRQNIRIVPYQNDTSKANMRESDAYIEYLLNNGILNTNAVVGNDTPTFQGTTNIYLDSNNVRVNGKLQKPEVISKPRQTNSNQSDIEAKKADIETAYDYITTSRYKGEDSRKTEVNKVGEDLAKRFITTLKEKGIVKEGFRMAPRTDGSVEKMKVNTDVDGNNLGNNWSTARKFKEEFRKFVDAELAALESSTTTTKDTYKDAINSIKQDKNGNWVGEYENSDGIFQSIKGEDEADVLRQINDLRDNKSSEPTGVASTVPASAFGIQPKANIEGVKVTTNSGNITIREDGKMFFDNGNEVTSTVVQNKALVKKELQEKTLRRVEHNGKKYGILSDDRIISLNESTAGNEVFRAGKDRDAILNKVKPQKVDNLSEAIPDGAEANEATNNYLNNMFSSLKGENTDNNSRNSQKSFVSSHEVPNSKESVKVKEVREATKVKDKIQATDEVVKELTKFLIVEKQVLKIGGEGWKVFSKGTNQEKFDKLKDMAEAWKINIDHIIKKC